MSLSSTLIGALPGVMVSWFCTAIPIEENVRRAVEPSGSRAPERRSLQRTGPCTRGLNLGNVANTVPKSEAGGVTLAGPARNHSAENEPKGEAVGKRIGLAVLGLCGIASVVGCSFLGDQGPEFTYWEPALSPDGGTLIYESMSGETLELYALDLATGEERRLTENDVEDWSPSWSPQGDRITFASNRDKNVDIFVLSVETLETHRLTTHEADDINPCWGVDGRIYFNSNRSDVWEIYAIDPDGLNLTKIIGSGSVE